MKRISVFEPYIDYLNAPEPTRRDNLISRTRGRHSRSMQELIECEDVFIDGCPRKLIVSESDGEDKHIKNICSLVGETFGRGQYVRWRDAVWLITSQSVHNQIYVKGEMTMCNYPLRWIGKDGRVVERYCYTADSPIYRTGVKKDEELQVPAMQKTVVLPFDDETSALRRGTRFIIDNNTSAKDPDVYISNKIDTVSEYYGEGNGLVLLTVAETQFSNATDNAELRVANYYTPAHKQPEHKHQELNCKIIFEGQPKLLTAQKICSAKFFNNIGTEVKAEPIWVLTAENGDDTDIVELTEFEDGSVGLKRVTGYADTGKKVALTLKDSDEICEDKVIFQLA